MVGIVSSFNQVTTYTGIKGWFMAHILKKAIPTVQENGKNIYYNTRSLVKHAFSVGNQNLNCQALKTDAKIHQVILETLNPVVGKPITTKKVADLFNRLHASLELKCAPTHEKASEVATKVFNAMKTEHLQVVTYDVETLKKLLKPGDIICRKYDDDTPNTVVKGQKFQQLWMASPREREGHKFSHLAIYVGDGKVAEAVWPNEHHDEVRILDLDNPDFAMSDDKHFQYMITRSSDPKLAQDASKVAQFIATDVGKDAARPKPSELRYSIFRAIQSVLHSGNFGLFAKYRYIKQYLEYKEGRKPVDYFDKANLFCSYLVGMCYQMAESQTTCPKLFGNSKPLPSITKTHFGTVIQRTLWARGQRWQNLKALNKEVKMRFDAKRMSPQYFRNFTIRNPDLFKDVIFVKKPV